MATQRRQRREKAADVRVGWGVAVRAGVHLFPCAGRKQLGARSRLSHLPHRIAPWERGGRGLLYPCGRARHGDVRGSAFPPAVAVRPCRILAIRMCRDHTCQFCTEDYISLVLIE